MLSRNFSLILSANMVLGSAMPMLIILGSLTGAYLAPDPALATVPPTVQMLGGIVVAAPMSLFMGRFGRKLGFVLGAALTIIGGVSGALAIFWQSFALHCLAHGMMGAALIVVNYFRFAAAEVVPEPQKARAISFTLASGLVAALVGPELFTQVKDSLAPLPFAGAYLGIAGLGGLGSVPILAMTLEPIQVNAKSKQTGGRGWQILRTHPKIALAVGVTALSQAIMVLLMTPTPLAMIGCGFGEPEAANVIRWHVVAMFAPGLMTGSLINRYGTGLIVVIGLILLSLAAFIAGLGLTLELFYLSLVLLGLGWNFGFIGGTHLLQQATTIEQRPLVQGINDTILAASSASASLMSGVMFATWGWIELNQIAMPLMVGAVAVVLIQLRRARVGYVG